VSNATPRYVLGSMTDVAMVLRRLVRSGWRVHDGFAIPDPPWDVTGSRLVCSGRVGDRGSARLAVLAAARGAGVVAVADLATSLGQAFFADLARVGPVGTDPAADPAAGVRGPLLVPEQRALLERLAGGETIAAAAAAEFLSLRTANRRIAEAREILGVRTTREAVMAYLKLRSGEPPPPR